MTQWQCTSIVFTRLPFTFTSRRGDEAVAGDPLAPPPAAAWRGSCASSTMLQSVNTRAGAAAASLLATSVPAIIDSSCVVWLGW